MKRTTKRSHARKRQTTTARGGTSARGTGPRKTTTVKRAGSRGAGTLTRALQPMPAFVRRALAERGLTAAYRQRPPYQRNDYLGWLASAQRDATRQKRLEQMPRELAGGQKYMNMPWEPRAARG